MSADTPDYKDTINLPVTDFPMRAGLPGREPIWLDRWAKIGVYDKLREKKVVNHLCYTMVHLMRMGISILDTL